MEEDIIKQFKGLKNYQKIILLFAILTPAMPKLGISEGVTMYPLEILLTIFFPILIKDIKFKYQKIFLAYWLVTLILTLFSLSEIFDTAGLLRVFKGMIYIPIMYIAFIGFRDNVFSLKSLLYVFIIASIFNILILLNNNLSFLSLNIWNVESIGAGLSNRFFNLKTLQLDTIKTGAHGIWGNYSSLIYAIVIVLRFHKRISLKLFLLCVFLAGFNVMMSVSREGLITFFLVSISYLFLSTKKYTYKFNPKSILILIVFIVAVSISIINWGDKLPLVQKVLYTSESYEESGTEGNIQLRINGWKALLLSYKEEPIRIFIGYGYNKENYSRHMLVARKHFGQYYAPIPESFFIQSLGYGGILAFLLSLLIWINIYKIIRRVKRINYRIVLYLYFVGLLIGNIVSGASFLADVLYCQIFIILGVTYFLNKDENFTNYIEK